MAERDVLRMTDDEVLALLDEGRRVQVATHNADGTIHIVPMSYFLRDGRIAFWTDGGSQKVANLRRDPSVTCLVELGSAFTDFRAVQVRGRAEVHDDLDVSREGGEALFTRYSGGPLDDQARAGVEALAPIRVLVVVEPDRVVSWDHRKLAGVRPESIGK